MGKPSIAAVVNCGIREHFLPAVLGGLLQQDYAGDLTIQLNYFGDPDTLHSLGISEDQSLPGRRLRISYLRQPECFFNISFGNNMGAYLTESDYLLFLPGDLVLPPDFCSQSVQISEEGNLQVLRHGLYVRADAATTTEFLEVARSSLQAPGGAPYTSLRTACEERGLSGVAWIDGLLFITRRLFNETAYDEQVLCMEDTEFALRTQIFCREQGWAFGEYPQYEDRLLPAYHLYHHEAVSVHNAQRFMRRRVEAVRACHAAGRPLERYRAVDVSDIRDIEARALLPQGLKLKIAAFRRLRSLARRVGM